MKRQRRRWIGTAGLALAAMLIAPGDGRWALAPLSRVAQAQTIPADALLQRLKATGHVNDFAQLLNAAEHTAMKERLVQ